MSQLAAALVSAYTKANYRVVIDNNSFVLRVDQYCQDLSALFQAIKASYCCVVTACNPFGEIVADKENVDSLAKLENELRSQNYRFFPCTGEDPEQQWPPEAGFLVTDISRSAACALGMRYRQNAIVYANADAVPSLVLLR